MRIKCENLTVGYSGKPVASNISFSVGNGEYVGIVGENGAGKSTLMKTLLGLLSPIAGTCACDGGQIGYLPQQTVVQKDFPATVSEIVRSGCITRSFFSGKKEKVLVAEMLQRLKIMDLRDKSYRELSGGQQQRVLLARALCASRECLLLDEPVAGLDPEATMQLYDTLSELNKKGITVVLISHDINAVQENATHILHVATDSWFGTSAEWRNRRNV